MSQTFIKGIRVRTADTLSKETEVDTHRNYKNNRMAGAEGEIWRYVSDLPVPCWHVVHANDWIGVYTEDELTIL